MLLNILKYEKKLPSYLVACIGGGSNALGLFYSFLNDDNVNIINIGPGTGSEGHKSNEKLINKDLVDYFLLLENFLLKF